MPNTVDELLDLLDLERIEADLFRGKQPNTSAQRAFGGQVLAQALVAGNRTVEADRLPHSMHAYFLRPGLTVAPIVYDVESVRDGRSFSTRRVMARQNGKKIFALSVSYQVGETGLEHQDLEPDTPEPDKCPKLSDVLAAGTGRPADIWEAEWGALDVRFVGDSRPGTGTIKKFNHQAHMRVWVRTTSELPADPNLHAAVLAYASDLTLLSVSTVPHDVRYGTKEVLPASVDHAMWFHRPIRADRWWLYDMVSPTAVAGRGFGLGRVFQDELMVATAAQEGLIRVPKTEEEANAAMGFFG